MLIAENIALSIEKHLKALAEFTATPGEGVTRFPFTKQARQCVDYLGEAMKNAGLDVRTDGSGAVIGRLEGKTDKTIIVGSHYDSVQHGGEYDGIAGVVCGLVLAEYLHENNVTPFYSLEIIGMNDEEGARFKGGFHSSKAMLGLTAREELENTRDSNSVSISEAMAQWGLSVDDFMAAKRDLSKIRAFLEVHIEQGPVLEAKNKEIGIVNTIVGMERFLCEIYGRADHAGTTPMGMRKDALAAAAKVITEAERAASQEGDSVATVGYINVLPNEINTIAEKVTFTLDVRSVEDEKVSRITKSCLDKLKSVCAADKLECTVTNTLSVSPTKMNTEIKNLIADSCNKRGFSSMELNSGAGHDSLPIGKEIPTAMIFIPTKDGRSHCPVEFCKYSDLAKSVLILYDVISQIK